MMRKTILIWLLAALVLCGCGAAPEAAETTDAPSIPAQTAPPEGYYEAGSALETQTDGAVRVYPLTGLTCDGIAPMEDGLLLFTGMENGTRLTKLSGEDLYPAASIDLAFNLTTGDPSLLVNGEGVSFYDSQNRKTVILDENLREVTTVATPEDMTGTPLLSADRLTLYYCTGSNLCALDLDTGIPRVLRQHSAPLTLEAVLMEGDLLQCRQEDGSTLFFSAQTGQLVEETESTLLLETSGGRYVAVLSQGDMTTLVFGTGDTPTQTLFTGAQADLTLLGTSFAALEQGSDALNYYDLSSGKRTSTLALAAELTAVADGGSGSLWLLDSNATLYRWDTSALPSGDQSVYTGTYYTRSNPDLAGIAECQEMARQIGERHGVEILVWEDALAVAPWDYRVTEEYLVNVLTEQLTLLDQRLGNFPEGFLAQLSENSSGLTICLVRQIEGYSGQETVESASGLQYWVEDHAYIALSTVSGTEGGLYHELCHVIDTRVFAESNAYDQWEEINPSGFKYDYDYAANATRNAGEYLREAARCFIDTYSMSFPKEDRARVLEYAMTPGNESYFQSETMQTKLMQICLGFREAFGLKKSSETFLWEQYLNESLAYTK